MPQILCTILHASIVFYVSHGQVNVAIVAAYLAPPAGSAKKYKSARVAYYIHTRKRDVYVTHSHHYKVHRLSQ